MDSSPPSASLTRRAAGQKKPHPSSPLLRPIITARLHTALVCRRLNGHYTMRYSTFPPIRALFFSMFQYSLIPLLNLAYLISCTPYVSILSLYIMYIQRTLHSFLFLFLFLTYSIFQPWRVYISLLPSVVIGWNGVHKRDMLAGYYTIQSQMFIPIGISAYTVRQAPKVLESSCSRLVTSMSIILEWGFVSKWRVGSGPALHTNLKSPI